MMKIDRLLEEMVKRGASDLHISANSSPRIRVDGKLKPLDLPPLAPGEAKELCFSLLTETQRQKFRERNELDISFGIKGLSRFRANIFSQRGSISAAIRTVPFKIPSFEDLGLPLILEDFVKKPKGLILVTGPSGSGKSTTVAAMIDRINSELQGHIVTIEDPIEYLHPHKRCLVSQREVYSDTESFREAIKYVLRQDPDVVFIGEMRDQETIETALSISETGHLSIATLHTNNSAQTIHRILDYFPASQQKQVLGQLSLTLIAILSQLLLPRKDVLGRVLALEILIPSPAIQNLIREGKIHNIYSMMLMERAKYGSQTLNQSLQKLYLDGCIDYEEAIARSSLPDELIRLIKEGEG
ncbi:MAG: type IV pili twitching motility protein PilT [Nitrospinae bacterium RIFCSPLOWO2_12_FULL_45_22]|nr:MAG: type IV pili twitching motility protein PilT [Nitrospinae bacterium RIFCSPLOWO2_12_FULL_45_22]